MAVEHEVHGMLGHLFPVNEKLRFCYNSDEYQKLCSILVFLGLVKRLEPRQLLVLSALGRNASIHRAARDLSLTQSAVSKTLAEIEAGMGSALFLRSRQGIAATALGRLVLRRVEHLLDLLDHGIGRHGKEAPVLKIGYVSDLHGMALGQAFVRWRLSQPLSLRLVELDSQPLGLQLLQNAELDALVLDEPGEQELRTISNRMVPVLRKSHPLLVKGTSLSLQDVQALDWILPTAGAPFHRALQSWMVRAGIEAAVNLWRLPAGQALSTVVAQSDVLAWLPAAQASWFQQMGVLMPVRLTDVPDIEAPAYLLLGAHVQADPVLQQGVALFAHFMDHSSACFEVQ